MELLCFFDLPVETGRDRRNYRRFRKFLLKSGFIMVEESVYARMVINGNARRALEESVRKNKPPKGLVALMAVTEKQFANMEMIVGDFSTDVVVASQKVIEV